MPQLLYGIVAVFCILFTHPLPVYAGMSQTPINFYNTSGDQTVTITFANSTSQTVTEVNAYVDQTYLQMGTGTGSLSGCTTAERVDDGSFRFSGCSVSVGSSVSGSFPVVAIGGEYTESLGMNYTYGDSSNEIQVTISGTPSSATPTPTSSTSSTTTTVIITGTPQPTARPTSTPVPDRTPPSAILTTVLEKSYVKTPTIDGKATDPSGVDALDYTTDGGRNWLPVDTIGSPGKSATTFSFTPIGLEDGNYEVSVRGTDGKGNRGSGSRASILVIDRLPPLIGGTVFTLGPQVLEPSREGVIRTLAGLTQKITLSAVGGPTQMDLSVGDLLVPVKKNSDTGLWSGQIRLDVPGTYALKIHAVDGAGNIGDKTLSSIVALSGGTVTHRSVALGKATVTVYYLDTATKRFILWDGHSYGQENPQKTSREGSYGLYLPQGSYYLRIDAGGYRSQVSSIFTLSRASPITTTFTLSPSRSFRLGPWIIPLPDFRQTSVDIIIESRSIPDSAVSDQAVVGSELPYVSLALDATAITTTSLRGKPTILTFFNTWSPDASSQIGILESLSEKKEINVVGIVPQETIASVSIFRKRGGYAVPILADPDGLLVEPLGIQSIPTHIFVNRKGAIQSITTGVLSKEEILNLVIQ